MLFPGRAEHLLLSQEQQDSWDPPIPFWPPSWQVPLFMNKVRNSQPTAQEMAVKLPGGYMPRRGKRGREGIASVQSWVLGFASTDTDRLRVHNGWPEPLNSVQKPQWTLGSLPRREDICMDFVSQRQDTYRADGFCLCLSFDCYSTHPTFSASSLLTSSQPYWRENA